MKKMMVCCIVLTIMTFLVTNVVAQGHGPMFDISVDPHMEGWPQACYNSNADEYLVVWEDYRNDGSDIYGQFLNGDGTLKDTDFPICLAAGEQYWPRLDFDPQLDQFLIVFEDWRDPANGDICGVFIASDGSFVDAPTSGEDHTFAICSNPAKIYTCSVAYNLDTRRYLVVWGDYRNDPTGSSYTGADVFGQIVDSDGRLLPPPTPADPTTNFAIAEDPEIFESVADVTFCMGTHEWFVVYGTNTGYVHGQRVNGLGALINPDGSAVPDTGWTNSAIVVSKQFQNGPDCLQARVKANSELLDTVEGWIECEVVWKGKDPELEDNDVWGQRIGFLGDMENWEAQYVDVNGDITAEVSNHAISIQDGWCGPPEIDFSVADNEFLVSWGDPRNEDVNGHDLYYQRLYVDMAQTQDMIWLDDDRVNVVNETENTPVFTTENYEGSMMGIAHSAARNEFMVAFTYEDFSAGREGDVMGVIAKGTPPVAVEDGAPVPDTFKVDANYPNPFSSLTTIRFAQPADGQVTVIVYDLMGRKIATLLDGVLQAGYQEIVWNGKDGGDNDVAAGVYFYEVRSSDRVSVQKMVLVR